VAKIIKERERKTASRIELNFYERETGEICFGFPLIDGEVIPCKEGDEPDKHVKCSTDECAWWDNYLFVKDNDKYQSRIETETWSWVEPAVAICECGKEITLNYDAEDCPCCGRLHNLFGQELLPRHMWEEDYDEY
jgi:hypothetical protein